MQITHVHHIAIATPDPHALAIFYRDVLGLPEVRRLKDARGLRSVWLNMAAPDAMQILMLERTDDTADAATESPDSSAKPAQDQASSTRAGAAHPYHWKRPGLHLLALAIPSHDRVRWEEHLHSLGVAIEDRSEFTLYVRDPEGNRIALSWFDGQPSTSTSPTVEGPLRPAEPD